MPTECSFYPNTAGQDPGGRRNRWIVWLWNWTTEHQDLIQVLGIYPTWVKNSTGNSEIFPIWMWNENVEINVCSSTGGWGGWLGGWPPQTAWVLTGQNNVNVKNDAGKVEVVPVLKHRECFPFCENENKEIFQAGWVFTPGFLNRLYKSRAWPGKVVKYRVCREGGGGRGINCKTNTDGPSYWGSSNGDHFCIELVELFRQSFPQQHVR